MRVINNNNGRSTVFARGMHYSDQLGRREISAIEKQAGLSSDEVRSILVFLENDPAASAAFWDGLLKDYPVDWRQKPSPGASNFKLYDYSLPITPPYFVPGVMSNPDMSGRLVAALSANKEKFEDPLLRLVQHRNEYAAHRDSYMAKAISKFNGEVLQDYLNKARSADGGEFLFAVRNPEADLNQAALTLYKKDAFDGFCSERDAQAKAILSDALGDYSGLNLFEIHAKVFMEHALPVYRQFAPAAGSVLTARAESISSPTPGF